MSFIRTVLGSIAPAELGVCHSHEHLIIDRSFAADHEPDFLLDSVENGISELQELKSLGVGACVDSMPCDCGRNAGKLAEISRGSGVHIIAPTGLHLAKYYDSGHWSNYESVANLTRLFVADIEVGIDANDYSSPLVSRTDIKAGLIKVAALREWDERTRRIFQAAANAHGTTGCPILTHTEEGQLALEQALFLKEHGVDLGHVVLSHLDRNPDPQTHIEVLQTGVTIEYDSHFRWKNRADNPTLELLKTLLPQFPDQIVLGMDAARRSYWKSYGGGPGLSYLYNDFRQQMLEAGIAPELVHKVFVTTPARVFSFKENQ
jgi:phosphotriesterase-related protein